MQLLIFLGHSGTSCTLYNVILKTWVVNRCHNTAQMQERRRRRGRAHNGTGCDLYSDFFFLKYVVRDNYKQKQKIESCETQENEGMKKEKCSLLHVSQDGPN